MAIWERRLGENHPAVAAECTRLAALYRRLGRMNEAESSYRRALAIMEKTNGPDHPEVATTLLNYAGLLRQMKRKGEAQRMEERARAILDSHTPPPGKVSGPVNSIR